MADIETIEKLAERQKRLLVASEELLRFIEERQDSTHIVIKIARIMKILSPDFETIAAVKIIEKFTEESQNCLKGTKKISSQLIAEERESIYD